MAYPTPSMALTLEETRKNLLAPGWGYKSRKIGSVGFPRGKARFHSCTGFTCFISYQNKKCDCKAACGINVKKIVPHASPSRPCQPPMLPEAVAMRHASRVPAGELSPTLAPHPQTHHHTWCTRTPANTRAAPMHTHEWHQPKPAEASEVRAHASP